MRNHFLMANPECREGSARKSFVIMPIRVAVLMAAVTIGPGLLAVRLSKRGPQHFVVVASNRSVAEAIKEQLSKSQEETSKQAAEAKQKSLRRSGSAPPSQVVTDIDTNTSAEERAALTDKVRKKVIDGVIWATDDALAAKKLPYINLNVATIIQTAILQEGISNALHRESLKGKGLSAAEIDDIFKRVQLDPQNAKPGGPGGADPQGTLAASIVMVMILYISLILYGVNVMRSVLEDKTSRIMEVMLSVAP